MVRFGLQIQSVKNVDLLLNARRVVVVSFFFIDTSTTELYTLSLHDALPICGSVAAEKEDPLRRPRGLPSATRAGHRAGRDRKSTRLNSSHVEISYAVFCLKKKRKSSPSGWRSRRCSPSQRSGQPAPRIRHLT